MATMDYPDFGQFDGAAMETVDSTDVRFWVEVGKLVIPLVNQRSLVQSGNAGVNVTFYRSDNTSTTVACVLLYFEFKLNS